ncbi:MAG TPA: hypothetical protein VGB17_04260 [Pyrinomonadaceae bacterium]
MNTLQITCNTDELNLERKLQSLDTVLDNGEKATEAVYKTTDTKKLGKLKIEKFSEARKSAALFQGRAFILTQPVDVLVFRE